MGLSKLPKTYKECRTVLGYNDIITGHKNKLIYTFQRLLTCRDAYLKTMDWEPDWNDEEYKFVIINRGGRIVKDRLIAKNTLLAFPNEEIRDIFFNKFESLIEECKDLL